VFGVCSQKLYLGRWQASICVSLHRRCSGEEKEGEPISNRLLQQRRVGLNKNLTSRTQGNILVYFNGKMVPVLQAASHLDESREYFCFPVLQHQGSLRGRGSTCDCPCGTTPSTRELLPPPPTPPQPGNRCHKHHYTGLHSVSLSGEEQEEKINF